MRQVHLKKPRPRLFVFSLRTGWSAYALLKLCWSDCFGNETVHRCCSLRNARVRCRWDLCAVAKPRRAFLTPMAALIEAIGLTTALEAIAPNEKKEWRWCLYVVAGTKS